MTGQHSTDPEKRHLGFVLGAMLVCVFLMGGGARGDVASLIVLRPIAAIACAIALVTLDREAIGRHRFIFTMAVAAAALAALHLLPLPPSLWQALSGRGIVAEIDAAAGLAGLWRPLAMVPSAASNAAFSLLVPLSVLLFGAQISYRQHRMILRVVLVLGAFSALLAVAQLLGDRAGPLYLYRITNNGSAVGLFSNRNHQAFLLAALLAMLAAFAAFRHGERLEASLRGIVALAGAVFLVPLVLVTGSRAGMAAALVAIAAAALIYRPGQHARRGAAAPIWRRAPVIAGFAVAAMAGVTILATRAEAVRRLLAPDDATDLRLPFWRTTIEMIGAYFPFGSGAGSFAETYQLREADALLGANYANHAHNDWLETVATYGLPGALLALAALAGWARASWAIWRTPIDDRSILARLGSALVLIFGLTSLVDYPLRTPSLACLFVLACLWMRGGARRDASTLS